MNDQPIHRKKASERTQDMLSLREEKIRRMREQKYELMDLEHKITTRILKDGNPNLLKVDWAKAERYYRGQS